MVRLSRSRIEELGGRVVQAYLKLPELEGRPVFRIDPELFCDRFLHLRLEYRRLSLSGSVLGLTAFDSVIVDLPEGSYVLDGKTVLIEQYLNTEDSVVGRRNFTIMHEASHQLLKRFFPNDYWKRSHERRIVHYCMADAAYSSPITDWEEWQTNALASAVFLPRSLVEQAMKTVGLEGRIECLNRIFHRQEFEKFAAMGELLGCSRKALAIRMKQFGLVGEDYLDNPYRMIDVEVE